MGFADAPCRTRAAVQVRLNHWDGIRLRCACALVTSREFRSRANINKPPPPPP
eukprot:CAMPEP_0173425800 /NCGR_PEP_ID=MMETSP1357-20121228/5426_1 /TAXON_ID=77926 /ORGANISM="Hemiselmis rufescens, Strain PCC563" /LENGTH=52 /DNA_ID=CAMNT_0014389319 /DNA_START=86 /DNA_END=240 /DNA_ORIENTATION=-